jgi:hypothetical protein
LPGFDPALLHVVNGDLAAGSFLHSFGASDRLLIHRDVLSCGPLPRCAKVPAWQKVRLEFWKSSLAFLRTFDFEPSPIDLLKNAERLRAPELPCVWAGTGNSDQLLISLVLHLVTMAGEDVHNLHVVQFENHPDSAKRVRSAGELGREQMHAHPEPRKLSPTELAAYRDAWVAVTATDPAAIESFGARHPDAPWYLREAVGKFLRRYPDRAGLNFWDRRLLEEVPARGPKANEVVRATVGAMLEDADLVGDLYTYSRLLRMGAGSLPQPLVNLTGNRQQSARTEVALTELGAQVLDGKASSWPANPIEDWAGGVHLSSATGNLWFHEDGKLVRPPPSG